MHTHWPCRHGVLKAHGRESLLAILHFKHELVGDIQVSVKVQSCGCVVQTGTGVATRECKPNNVKAIVLFILTSDGDTISCFTNEEPSWQQRYII